MKGNGLPAGAGPLPGEQAESPATRDLPLSENRLRWLRFLAEKGETPWRRMPRAKNNRAISNLTWRPMVSAGLIDARYVQATSWQNPSDWSFSITDAGRAAIRKAEGA